MISKENRFHGYGSLRYVYRNAKTVRGPLCSLKYVTNNRRDTYRLSVVVNKKVNKSAVTRNKIRRILYESFRLNAHLIEEPYDIVVTVFSDNLINLSNEEVNRLVKAQLREAGIIKA
jgi:ribonuclease P protein component